MHNYIEEWKSEFKEKFKKGIILKLSDITHDSPVKLASPGEIQLFTIWYKSIVGFSFISPDLKNLNEIYIHGPTHIKLQYFNFEDQTDSDLTSEDFMLALSILTFKNQIAWNLSKPFASFQTDLLGSSVRVTLTHPSLSPKNQPKAFIRFNHSSELSLANFNIDEAKQLNLQDMIRTKKNILIAGATGSGKTSFLNCLLSNIPIKDHTVILEDTFELKSPHAHTTRLVADNLIEGRSLNSYMQYCMRMSPDRIILGEMRSNEVEPYLLAMNTGHKGTMATVHANSAKDAIDRLALLFKIYSSKDLSYELILKLITNSIDYVVFLENKQIKEIINVFGSEKSNVFYEAC